MEQFDGLQKMMDEYNHLKKAYDLLEQVYVTVDSYTKKINGKECGDLFYRIAEYFGMDDSE